MTRAKPRYRMGSGDLTLMLLAIGSAGIIIVLAWRIGDAVLFAMRGGF